jgi:uncharacterized membrane protein
MNATESFFIIVFVIFLFVAVQFLSKTNETYKKFQESIYPLLLLLILLVIFGYDLFQAYTQQKMGTIRLIAYLALVGYFIFRVIEYFRRRNQKS